MTYTMNYAGRQYSVVAESYYHAIDQIYNMLTQAGYSVDRHKIKQYDYRKHATKRNGKTGHACLPNRAAAYTGQR